MKPSSESGELSKWQRWWFATLGLLVLSLLGAWMIHTRVERGLVAALRERADDFAWHFPPRTARVPGGLTVESFQACANQVPGWDIMVVLVPYSWGPDVIDDPLLVNQSEELRRELKALEGYSNDGPYRIIVIRDGRIVEDFWLETTAVFDCFVIARDG